MIKGFIKDCVLFGGSRFHKLLGAIVWLALLRIALGIMALFNN